MVHGIHTSQRSSASRDGVFIERDVRPRILEYVGSSTRLTRHARLYRLKSFKGVPERTPRNSNDARHHRRFTQYSLPCWHFPFVPPPRRPPRHPFCHPVLFFIILAACNPTWKRALPATEKQMLEDQQEPPPEHAFGVRPLNPLRSFPS